MNILLGNLSTSDICKRLGISITEQETETLENMRSQNANISKGKWHCFDIPFVIVCGDKETAIRVRDVYFNYSGQMKGLLQISIQEGN